MPRITKDPTERRQEILDTALKLFWEKGYEKTSMTEIAQAMQVAQGLCYRYFPSKEALFQTAVDQYAQRQVDQIASVLRKPGLTLVQVVEQMPTFLETEAEDSAIAKLCHGPESEKLHGPHAPVLLELVLVAGVVGAGAHKALELEQIAGLELAPFLLAAVFGSGKAEQAQGG